MHTDYFCQTCGQKCGLTIGPSTAGLESVCCGSMYTTVVYYDQASDSGLPEGFFFTEDGIQTPSGWYNWRTYITQLLKVRL